MARAAKRHRVYFVEEPIRRGSATYFESHAVDGLTVVVPILPEGVGGEAADIALRDGVNHYMARQGIEQPLLWYYTPMAMRWTGHVPARGLVYDCMDELRNFKFADPRLCELEDELITRASVVFTGGRSLFEAKRHRHPNTYLFPSSVDGAHFRQARMPLAQPVDQAALPRPRIGYYGVIDERIDLALIDALAAARPEWSLVMLGPLAKVAPDDLPRRDNIRWLGPKSYAELPAYLSGWDVAIMPFALNESTRYISPTKTPEYLSGGRPVVSTPITDIVRPYGDEGLVSIAADADAFVTAIDDALSGNRSDLIARADRFLAGQSWDATWAEMERLVMEHTHERPGLRQQLRPVMDPNAAPPTTAAAGFALQSAPATLLRGTPAAARRK